METSCPAPEWFMRVPWEEAWNSWHLHLIRSALARQLAGGQRTSWSQLHPQRGLRWAQTDPRLRPQGPTGEVEAEGGRPGPRWLLGGGTGAGGRPPGAQAVPLLELGDAQAHVLAAVATVAGPTAEGGGLAAELRMPQVILVQVPQAATAGQHCGRACLGLPGWSPASLSPP